MVNGIKSFSGNAGYQIEMNFFKTLFWEISYRIHTSGKECTTQFYIYNTTFYNYVQEIRENIFSQKTWSSDMKSSISGGGHMDELKKYMNIYPTFLHIFKDA